MLDALHTREPRETVSLVLAGGAALGAYEAGAYAALHEAGGPLPDWVAGSSIGSINAAIIAGNPPERRVEQQVVDTAMFADPEDSSSIGFVETVQLSQSFYTQLRRHPVPVEDAAIRAINRHSIALDIYCWLAYRLHALDKLSPISWRALQAQFGAGTDHLRNFRSRFLENLDLALAVYPAAQVDVGPRGLTLHPSSPPIARIEARRLP